MARKALTLGKGKGSIAHNNREYKAHNVDPARTSENVVYVSRPIGQTYDDLFGEAVRRFNEKARADRRIEGSYFEYLFKHSPDSQAAKNVLAGNNKQKSFYEDLVQVGDMQDSGIGTADRALVAKCLDKYMRGWQERNPNFHVFNAVLHMDEKTPHLHIDYIPVADSARGLPKQNGMTKALAQMGHETRSGDALGFTAWRKKERKILEDICREHGIEAREPGQSRGVSLTLMNIRHKKTQKNKRLKMKLMSLWIYMASTRIPSETRNIYSIS